MKFKHDTIIINDDGNIIRKDWSVFPVRHDITVLPADQPRQLKLGWTVKETIGVGIINKGSK